MTEMRLSVVAASLPYCVGTGSENKHMPALGKASSEHL